MRVLINSAESGGNLFWGMQFRTCENFGESTDFSLVLSPKFSQTQKPHRHYFDGCFASLANPADCDSLRESTANYAQIAESNLDSAESQNLGGKSNKKSLLKFLLLFAFAKRRVPLNHINFNPPSKADSQNLAKKIARIFE